jgi:hypothetical protein
MGYELELDDWKKESRERVEEALQKGNRLHPSFSGMQTQENLAALERVREALQEASHGRAEKDYK